MRDLRSLVWLRWKQFKDAAVYWLRVLGYQPKDKSFSQNLYVLYLVIIGCFWLFAMWAWAYEQATGTGRSLTPEGLTTILDGIPLVLLGIQLFAIRSALSGTPLKLSFPDMAYLAGSPIDRSAPVLLGYIRQVIPRVLLIAVILALVGIAAITPIDRDATGTASVNIVLAAVPIVMLSWASAWMLGLLRMAFVKSPLRRLLWLVPATILILASVLPDLILWPGRLLVLAMVGTSLPFAWALVLAVTVASIAAIVYLGRQINMTDAADESVLYARIQALGLLAYTQPQLQARIHVQARQAARKPFLRLPRAQGVWGFVTRAALSYIRHPLMLLTCALWGAAMTQAAVFVVANELPAQLWIGWVLVAGLAPPMGMLHVFQADVEERFLRQFLPVNGFELFFADVLLPLVATSIGAMATLALQDFPPETIMLGIIAIPMVAITIALCGAVALTNARVLQTRMIATVVSFGAAIGATLALGSPLGGLGVSLVAVLVMGGMLSADA